MEKIAALQTSSLRIPANAILCSALLLKFKAKTLRLPSLAEWEEELAAEETEEDIRKQQKLFLEEGFPELIAPRMLREGKVPLDALVASLESILAVTKRRKMLAERKQLEFRIPFSEINIEGRMNTVLAACTALLAKQELVLFSQLSQGKPSVEVINMFIPLLFLASQNMLSVWQDDFFGEIFISAYKAPTEEAVSVPENPHAKPSL